MFAHEKLHVYTKALDFAARTAGWSSAWDRRHALVEQLARAAESLLLNLAEAAAHRGSPARLSTADYAIGSALECAACMDLARVKGFLTPAQAQEEKGRLCETTKMLIGLRKAWAGAIVREEPEFYRPKPETAPQKTLFHHETLEVYQQSLAFMEWFVLQPGAKELSNRLLRQIDEAGTSAVLNVAEGNGRYSELDHHRFLHIAQSASVKAAVYLDLCVKRELWLEAEATHGKEMLRRVGAMLLGF
jgi:four helix bundle protein